MKLITKKYAKNEDYQKGYFRGIYVSAFLLRRNLKVLSKISLRELIDFLDRSTRDDMKRFNDLKVKELVGKVVNYA